MLFFVNGANIQVFFNLKLFDIFFQKSWKCLNNCHTFALQIIKDKFDCLQPCKKMLKWYSSVNITPYLFVFKPFFNRLYV